MARKYTATLYTPNHVVLDRITGDYQTVLKEITSWLANRIASGDSIVFEVEGEE